MSTWEYRVIEFVDPKLGPWRAVHEVYRDDGGRFNGYAENPAAVVWEVADDGRTHGMDEGRRIMAAMVRALELPTLVETDFTRGKS